MLSKLTINNNSIYSSNNIYSFASLPAKPRFIKNLIEIIKNNGSNIFNYLELKEVCIIRILNKLFYESINNYFEIRLKQEINTITNFKNLNEENTILYMQNIDSQIPISNNNWLEFELKEVTKDMELLDKDTIIELKSIKKLLKFNENIYAPFCIIMGYKPSDIKVKSLGWKKIADSILNEPNISLKIKQLDFENFNDKDILKAFVYLNNDDLNLNRIKKYSIVFYKLIKWCQAVVSYHILIHPYTYRNKTSQIEVGSEVYKYVVFMDNIINKFYKFKRFLFNLGLVQIPLGDYVFNLQHNKNYNINEVFDVKKILEKNIIGNILSYLPLEKSIKFINANKFFVDAFKENLNIICYKIIKEIILFKLNSYQNLIQIIPLIYENNIFGKYFLMLDDILNSNLDTNNHGINYVPFLTKEHLNDIKNLKSENELIIKISKIFCVLFKIKVEKKENKKGEIISLYTKSIKLLAVKGVLNKLMRYFDKFELNKKQINVLMNEIIYLYEKKKIEEIKKINKGIYQILIWELYLYEYLKEFNPFMFLDMNKFYKKISDNQKNQNNDIIDMIKYYSELINYLKYYLKFKYHFHSLIFNNKFEAPNYEFILFITKLFQELNIQKIDISPIIDNLNIEKTKVANAYFENKDLVLINTRPEFYEKIMEEIFNINEKLYVNNSTYLNNNISIENTISNENENNLGIIKEENTISIPVGDNSSKIQNKDKDNSTSIKNNIYNENDNKNNSYYFNNSKINKININYINSNILKNNISISFNQLPNDIIIKNILLYLDIKSICPFSLLNKKSNECYKKNMFLRLLILENHKQIFENINEEIINSIHNKRTTFFTDYEIDPPNKEHALKLITQLKNKDIIELKNLFRKYNKTNEILISPLIILLGEKPKKEYNVNGTKKLNYFSVAQKLLNDRKINKKIKDINLETISNNVIKEIEKMFQNELFSINKMNGYSSCLYNLICWEMGVIEYHRSIRYFCVNYYDNQILNKEEIVFCGQMDNITIMYNKLKYYCYNYCNEYEKDAIKLMMDINKGIFEDSEDINNTNNKDENKNQDKIIIKKDEIESKNMNNLIKNETNELEDSINNEFDKNENINSSI